MGGLSKSKSCLQFSDARASTPSSHSAFGDLEATSLFLPPVGDEDGDDKPERLRLPRNGTSPCSLDEYLSTIPRIVARTESLLATRDGDRDSDGEAGDCPLGRASSCLNVLQGEVAHAVPTQADVVVSAEATTCHVVALRSTSGVGGSVPASSEPLVSVAHVDAPDVYDSCLEGMVREHIRHHDRACATSCGGAHQRQSDEHNEEDEDDFGFFLDEEADEGDSNLFAGGSLREQPDEQSSFLPMPSLGHHSSSRVPPPSTPLPAAPQEHPANNENNKPIEMELHMMGGYLDSDGTSKDISASLFKTFSRVADKYQDRVHISLSTAAISRLNSERCGGSIPGARPKSRGLGINTRTGEVFPVRTSLPSHLEGPAMEVRSARIMQRRRSLSVVHDARSGDGRSEIRVEPFLYEPDRRLDALLHIPDDVLLRVASTSPECESDNFCCNLRRTLSFVNTVPRETVFGDEAEPRPLVFTRSAAALNQWEAVTRQ